MGGTNPIIFMLLLLIAFQTYSVYDSNKKIWCVFRKSDRTKVGKWAKATQSRIEYDGGWYTVDPSRVTLIVKMLPLPTICKSLDFGFQSTVPLDPATGDTTLRPEERAALDTSDDMRALKDGNQQAVKGSVSIKQNMLQQYMPLITIIGFLVVGYLVYQVSQKVDAAGYAVNVAQSQLLKLMQAGGIK